MSSHRVQPEPRVVIRRQGRHKVKDPDCPLCTTGMHVIEGGA